MISECKNKLSIVYWVKIGFMNLDIEEKTQYYYYKLPTLNSKSRFRKCH